MKKILIVTFMSWTGGATAGWIVGVDSLSAYSSKAKLQFKAKSKDLNWNSDLNADGIIQRGLGYHIGYRYALLQIRLAHRTWSGDKMSDDGSFTSLGIGTYRQYEKYGIQFQWDWSVGIGKVTHEESEASSVDLYLKANPEIGVFIEGNGGIEIYPNVVLTLGYFLAFLEYDLSGHEPTNTNLTVSGTIRYEVSGVHFGLQYQF